MNIKIINKNGHYEVYSNDKFWSSCDNFEKVIEEIKLIENDEFENKTYKQIN